MVDQKLRAQFEVKRNAENPTIREIYLRGQKVYEWDDMANDNTPEDLVWCREIGDLFFEAVGIGLHLAMLLFKETISNEQQVRFVEIQQSLARIDELQGNEHV